MARDVIVAVNVDSTILFLPEGDVYEWTQARTKEIGRIARRLCPPGRSMARHSRYVSKGVLRRSIRTKTTFNGVRLDFGQVSVGPADQGGGNYVEHVLGGTAYQGMRYIYSHRGYANKAAIDAIITRRGVSAFGRYVQPSDLPVAWAMRFRTDGGRHWRVHGQRQNPFLTDAWNAVAARHPSAMGLFRGPRD
jgi:hypothetical protein